MSTGKKETQDQVKEQPVNDAQEVKASTENKEQTPENKKETKPASTKKTTSKKKVKKGYKLVKIDCDNAAGKYLLPYNRGQKVEMEEKQANEMIEAKDAIAL